MTMKRKLSPYVNTKTPAFATLVIKNGKTEFKGIQGCAVLEQGQCINKATLDTPFAICSVTKHMTAAAILMLEEEGKLSIEDCITQHLSLLPQKFKDIKIKHLIFHISGIPDYFGSNPAILDFDHIIKTGQAMDEALILKAILQTEPQGHSKAHVYSNSGYALLAQVIQAVSGQTYAQFMRQRFFAPLDMRTACMLSEATDQPHYAVPYNAWPLYTPTNWMKAAITSGEGGLLLSINDVEKWLYALSQGKLFKKTETMQKFLSVGQYDDGKDVIVYGQIKYGFGLMHSEEYRNGKKYISVTHGGSMPGSSALIGSLHHADQDIWMAYLNNSSSYPSFFDLLDQLKIEC